MGRGSGGGMRDEGYWVVGMDFEIDWSADGRIWHPPRSGASIGQFAGMATSYGQFSLVDS